MNEEHKFKNGDLIIGFGVWGLGFEVLNAPLAPKGGFCENPIKICLSSNLSPRFYSIARCFPLGTEGEKSE